MFPNSETCLKISALIKSITLIKFSEDDPKLIILLLVGLTIFPYQFLLTINPVNQLLLIAIKIMLSIMLIIMPNASNLAHNFMAIIPKGEHK